MTVFNDAACGITLPRQILARQILTHLGDSRSRRTFLDYLTWRVSGEESYLLDIYRHCMNVEDLMSKVQHSGRQHYLWGVTATSVAHLNTLWPGCWRGVFDNDPRSWNTGGVTQIPFLPPPTHPEALAELYRRGEQILVCSASSAGAIMAQIKSLGFAQEVAINVSELIGAQYFGLPELYHDQNELFVDAGAYDGSTTQEFFKWAGKSAAQAWCFEADPQNCRRCAAQLALPLSQGRVRLCNTGLWSRPGRLRLANSGLSTGYLTDTAGAAAGVSAQTADAGDIEVEVATLDEMLGERRVTFIKMDIEGAELQALQGAATLIRRNKPKLAICVYHRPEDILTIPAYILSLNPDYTLYLRHHTFEATETVLYAL
ncbi:MAG: FkbM family methyltransferase [Succinivibrio sp.]|nr:FkbM family methyltransferase [Succinivibrio sp.]